MEQAKQRGLDSPPKSKRALQELLDPYWSVKQPINDTEQYAFEIQKWYEYAILSLGVRHQDETNAARALYVTFEVVNHGRAPADNVTIRLFFPAGLSVEEFKSAMNLPLPETPPIPPSLEQQIRAEYPVRETTRPPWYLQFPREPASSYYAERLVYERESQSGKHGFRIWLQSLEHGSSVCTRPAHITFKYEPAQNLIVAYNLHASNQPVDSVGEICVEIRELDT